VSGSAVAAPEAERLTLGRDSGGTLVIRLTGTWRLSEGPPSIMAVERELGATPPAAVTFDASALGAWDSGLLTVLTHILERCRERHVPARRDGLPAGVQRLLALAEAVPERKDARAKPRDAPSLERLGCRDARRDDRAH